MGWSASVAGAPTPRAAVPNGYALRLVYIDPHLVLYLICLNINFDYCSHCLLDLWSLLTSDSCLLGIPLISTSHILEASNFHNPIPGSIGNTSIFRILSIQNTLSLPYS